MPARLPFPLFVRQLARHGLRELGRWTRYLLVGLIWTCCLPWCIRQVWRGFLWLADGTTPGDFDVQDTVTVLSNITGSNATRLFPQPSLLANITVPQYLERMLVTFPPMLISLAHVTRVMLGQGLMGKVIGFILYMLIPSMRQAGGGGIFEGYTADANTTTRRPPSMLSDIDFISSWSSSPLVNNVTIDVIEGQLICVLLVTAFILVFLIREWVINQQPILNMPDPDAAENPPPERAAEIERPRVGLHRPRNRRPGGEANIDVAGVDPAARPIAVPRRRRALTDDNILNDTGYELGRPAMPIRSQSLLDSGMDHEGANIEDAAGESSAAVPSPWEQPFAPHSPISDHSVGQHARDSLGSWTTEPDPVDLDDLGAYTDALNETQRYYEQRAIRPELADPLARRVFFAEVPDIVGETAFQQEATETLEPATDSDEQMIPTPDSSNDVDIMHPAAEFLDVDLQEALFDDPPQAEADENTVLQDQEPIDENSLLGRIAKWLWHTDVETEANGGVDTDRQEAFDEERIVEDIDAEAPFVPVHNQDPAQIPPLPPAFVPPPPEPNNFLGIDLNDAGDDAEDFDGVLELLGMEGPVFGMFQNVVFSLLLITLTLMMSFWFPYMWGKIALLFLSQPTTMVVRAPMFVLSRTADIVVDIIFFAAGLAGFLINQPMKLFKTLISRFAPSISNVLDTATIEGFTLDLSQRSGTRLERTLTAAILGLRPDVPNFSMQSHHALIVVKTYVKDSAEILASAVVQTQKLFTTERPTTRVVLLSFGHLLRSIPGYLGKMPQLGELTIEVIRQMFKDLVTEPTPSQDALDPSLARWNNEDRVLAVVLGYTLFAVAGIVFLEIAHLFLGLNDNEKVEGYFADSLRQAGGVMKVIVIIGIEMLVFPLYCGLLLDIALLPLFANATIAGRVAFILRTPLTGMFIHWFIGTCYMFHFALFVSICRKIMRKGVLYFIRDPDDPTFHPVRDVLERPVPAQLGKIAFSALVYGGLVTVCLGFVVWSLDWVGGVLPIQWSTPEPRLAFPVDIVFYNFLLPFILRKAEPSKKISSMYKWWFRGCARSLRLTNFLFGEEQQDEQYTHPKGFPWSLLCVDAVTKSQRDGTYVRAPASDSVRIPKGRDVFLEVTENNERVDGRPDSDFGMHGKRDQQFIKVYLPPNFRSRITTFIVLLWLFAATTGVTFTIGPLLVGRKVTQILAQSSLPPNDLYAFTVGIHLFAAVGYAVAYARPARDYLQAKLNSSGKQILASVLHVLGLAYLSVFTIVILPFVMSLITELYIHIPLFDMLEMVNLEKLKEASTSTTLPIDSPSTPVTDQPLPSATIYILQSWTVGLLYLRVLWRILTSVIDPNTPPARALRAILHNGLFQADIPLASRAFVLPATTICILLLVFPLTYMKLIITALGVTDPTKRMGMYRSAYPLFLWLTVNYVGLLYLRRKIERWRVKIRDEVYLIGERLHNFQEVKGKGGKGKEMEKEKGVVGT